MNARTFGLRLAGTIFGLVAILHLLRVVTNIPVIIGDWLMPVWVNLLGLIVTAAFSFWLFLVSSRMEG